MTKQLGKDYKQVYAIIRYEGNFKELQISITVTKLVWSQERAKSEVERLNKLNADKGCTYFWQVTRLENK